MHPRLVVHQSAPGPGGHAWARAAALLTTLALLVLAAAEPAMANPAGGPSLKVGQPVMAPGDQITVRGLGYKPQADAKPDDGRQGRDRSDYRRRRRRRELAEGKWLVAADLSSGLPRRAPGVA